MISDTSQNLSDFRPKASLIQLGESPIESYLLGLLMFLPRCLNTASDPVPAAPRSLQLGRLVVGSSNAFIKLSGGLPNCLVEDLPNNFQSFCFYQTSPWGTLTHLGETTSFKLFAKPMGVTSHEEFHLMLPSHWPGAHSMSSWETPEAFLVRHFLDVQLVRKGAILRGDEQPGTWPIFWFPIFTKIKPGEE